MKSFIATIAAALAGIGLIVSFTVPAAASVVEVLPAPVGTSNEIGARIRWGASGFEASVYDSNPFGQTPTLNPGGSPVWQTGLAYAFQVTYDLVTGTLGLSVDFNRNSSFGPGESISRTAFAAPGATSYAGLGFRYLSISGNEGGSTARSSLTDLVINGTSVPAMTPNGVFIQKFFANGPSALPSSWTVAGNITFTTAGTSQERPSWNFEFRNAATPIPVPAALPLMLTMVGGFGLAAWRRRAA